MGDQTNANGTPQAAGQPQGSMDIDRAGVPSTREYFTREETLALVQDAVEQTYRRAQGLVDQRYDRVQKAMQGLEETLKQQKELGIQITKEQEQQLRSQVMNQTLLTSNQAQLVGPPVPAGGQDESAEDTDPITEIALGFEKQHGVEIVEGDPEFGIVKVSGSPEEYLESYLQAINVKKARLSGPTPNPSLKGGEQPAQGRMPANLGAAGQPATARTFDNARNYLREGLSKT